MSLTTYNKKRNFNSTNEPIGKIKKTKHKKFVIQYHQARAKHYDFRLEHNGVLLSWAVPKGLSTNPNDKRLAVHVEDHPVDYINFEGIIPKGNYGAGMVKIFDDGTYLPVEDIDKGLKKGHLKFVLCGKKFKGGWSLIKTQNNNWLIVKTDDDFAITSTNKTKLPFKIAPVQLATLSADIPRGKNWIYEIKYDGYRIISYVDNGKVKMLSRNNIDYTKKFSSIANSLKLIEQQNFVVDGEIVVFDKNGKSDFGLLQNSLKTKKNNFCYVIFDLLAQNGEDLRQLPLINRKQKLESILYKSDNSLIFSAHVKNGKESFKFAKQNYLEGIVAKDITSAYTGKRTKDWLKIKCYLRQEFVVGGYCTSNKNKLISALLVGYYKNSKLVYAGKVGTGLSQNDKKSLHDKFLNMRRKTSPFSAEISEKNVVWLNPTIVAEIQYAELTSDNLLRQASFVGLRNDKSAKDVKLEI